jgi:hypothetical protein
LCAVQDFSTFNCDKMVNEYEESKETIMNTVRNPQCPFFFLSEDDFFYDRSDFHSVDNNRFNNHYSSFKSSNIRKRSCKTTSKQETNKKVHHDRYSRKIIKKQRQKSRKMDRRFVCIDAVKAENKAAAETLYLS